jgi:membrane protease YdiL (CAAX protease family)
MNDQKARQDLIHRYPVASFFILAFLLGTGLTFLVVQGVIPAELALASALSASIAGILVTAVVDGRAGLALMFRRMLIWRVGIGYWFFALLFLIIPILAGFLFNPLFNGDPLTFKEMQAALRLMPLFIIFIIGVGFGEELGWSGFLTPRLQARYSALASCVIRAVLVGFWHLPLLYYSQTELPSLASFPYASWIDQVGFPLAFTIMILLFSLPWSILFTWIFNNTRGSLLLVAVLHGSEFWLVFWMVSSRTDQNNLSNYWGYGALLMLSAAVLVVTNGAQNLSRKHTRVSHLQSSVSPMDPA